MFFAAAAVVVAWAIGMMFTVILICVPARGYWDQATPAKCQQDVQLISSIGNIVTEVILLALPLPVIWRLSLAPRQKAVLTGIFCLGFVAVVISLLRVSFIFSPHMHDDFTRDAVDIVCWTLAEITTGSLCASLITLRPLVSRVLPEFGTVRSALRAMTPGPSQKLNEYKLSSPSTAKRRGDGPISESPRVPSPEPVVPSPRPVHTGETGFAHPQSLVLVRQSHSQVSLDDRQAYRGGEMDMANWSCEDLASQPDYSQEREGLHFDANELAGLGPAVSAKPPTSSPTSSFTSVRSAPAEQTQLRYPPKYHGPAPSN